MVIALVAVLLYIGGMVGADLSARAQVARVAAAEGLEVRDLMVAPLPADPLGAEVEVLTAGGYVPGSFRWTRTPRVQLVTRNMVPLLRSPEGMPATTAHRIADVARARREVSRYLVWSRYPYMRIEPHGDGWSVAVSDARYDGFTGGGGLAGLTVLVETGELAP